MLLISFLFFSPASRYSQKSEAKERTGFVVCMRPLARTAGKARPLLPHNYRTSCSRALFSLSPCFFSSRAFSALCVASFFVVVEVARRWRGNVRVALFFLCRREEGGDEGGAANLASRCKGAQVDDTHSFLRRPLRMNSSGWTRKKGRGQCGSDGRAAKTST